MIPFVIKGYKLFQNKNLKTEEEVAQHLADKVREAGTAEQVDCVFNRIYLTSRTSLLNFFKKRHLPEIGYLNNCMLEIKKCGPAYIIEYRISFIPLFSLLLLLIPFALIALSSPNLEEPFLFNLPFFILTIFVGFNFIWLAVRYYIFIRSL